MRSRTMLGNTKDIPVPKRVERPCGRDHPAHVGHEVKIEGPLAVYSGAALGPLGSSGETVVQEEVSCPTHFRTCASIHWSAQQQASYGEVDTSERQDSREQG